MKNQLFSFAKCKAMVKQATKMSNLQHCCKMS